MLCGPLYQFVEGETLSKPMHPRIIFNQQLTDATHARMQVVSSATLHGRGVFTTLAVHQGRPFLWGSHWSRLVEHAGRVGVSHAEFEEAAVSDSLMRLIEANEVETGRARITLLAHGVRGLWKMPGGSDASRAADLLIMTGDVRTPAAETLGLTVSPFRINSHSPLCGLKSINYLEHVLAWEEARARKFDEAVRVNERGEVVSATMSNIFWVSDGTLHTPALATGALSGVTRACVVELARELAVPFVEGNGHLPELLEADEIFLTSSALGVAPVSVFDFRSYTPSAGSVVVRLREAFRQLTLR